jgi:hypothetical protein
LFPDDLIEWEFTGIETTDDEWSLPGTMKYLSATRETLELLRLPFVALADMIEVVLHSGIRDDQSACRRGLETRRTFRFSP